MTNLPEPGRIRHLTTAELADRLGYSARTVDDWRLDGKGPPYLRLARGVRYRLADVEAWEESRLVVPGERARLPELGGGLVLLAGGPRGGVAAVLLDGLDEEAEAGGDGSVGRGALQHRGREVGIARVAGDDRGERGQYVAAALGEPLRGDVNLVHQPEPSSVSPGA